jgi:hypothetical protein
MEGGNNFKVMDPMDETKNSQSMGTGGTNVGTLDG